ncbi:vignain-like [Hibiscus syriacus]|uniref:Vignain-like n=1 Tax=Hibiscus syriacus TaxID=106335 RepID=A0A6A3A0K4_HIBSY|nr:vignain-like [Hibiscus syriacus]
MEASHALNLHQLRPIKWGIQHEQQQKWKPPLEGWWKLNIDGAHKLDIGVTACGGALRDSNGEWIMGFTKALGRCSVLEAKLWGVVVGLEMTWNIGLRKVMVETDSKEVFKLLMQVFRTGVVNSASGSGRAWEYQGHRIGVTCDFGPRESKKAMMYSDTGRLNCNVGYTTFATPVRGLGSDHKEFSSMLPQNHRGCFCIGVGVWGQGDLPVVISCASLALADAGIMMYDLVAAVSACLVKNLVIDPILEEESYQDGSLVLSCMPSRYEVTQLTFTGEWSTPDINEAMHLCLDAYNKLGKVTSTCLKEAAASASQE